jgi:hypothetical protein
VQAVINIVLSPRKPKNAPRGEMIPPLHRQYPYYFIKEGEKYIYHTNKPITRMMKNHKMMMRRMPLT